MTPDIKPEDIFGPDKIGELMDQSGLTLSRLIMELAQKIEATEVKVFCQPSFRTKKLSDGTKIEIKTRSLVYSKKLKALSIQLQALDMALRLRKAYPDAKIDLNLKQPIQVVIADRFEATE